jgi:chromate transporter
MAGRSTDRAIAGAARTGADDAISGDLRPARAGAGGIGDPSRRRDPAAADVATPRQDTDQAGTETRRLRHRVLVMMFLKAGLAFGGGPGIMAALEEELVRKRRLASRDEFLKIYALGRLIPSGTMTAVAVAFGHRFGGWIGGALSVIALVLPSTLLTILLTQIYVLRDGGHLVELLSMIVLPAALAFIASATLRIARPFLRPSFDLVVCAAAAVAVASFDVHPVVVLLLGGLATLVVGSRESSDRKTGRSR